jgi:hypothetical protein
MAHFRQTLLLVSTQEQTSGALAGRLIRQLDAWPGVRVGEADCGLGTGFAITHRAGLQILHLHGDEAELRLTRPVIARLGDPLRESGRVTVLPGGDWVRVRLDTEYDVDLVMSLVSVAIKASDSAAHGGTSSPCNAARVRTPLR